jgi:hypothetical protein
VSVVSPAVPHDLPVFAAMDYAAILFFAEEAFNVGTRVR